jgi:hypothetical protein
MIWLKAGFVAAAIAAVLWWHENAVSRAAEAARLAERLVWQERQARALIEEDRARKETQAMIARVETEYWQRQAGAATQISELEKALADERHDSDGGDCAPAVSKRLRDKLQPIGR